MKTLVAFFSRTGHTLQIASEIAHQCGAALSPIREIRSRQGPWGYLRSGWEAIKCAEPPILPSMRNPSEYELVIIGTPIWDTRLAPPVRAYARQHSAQFQRVAFFCTKGGSRHESAFEELAGICGKSPVATLAIAERDLTGPAHREHLKFFLSRIAEAARSVDDRAADAKAA